VSAGSKKTNGNLLDVFKAIIEDFYSYEEERRDSYTDKGKRLFFKMEYIMPAL
jgi:hypothetical protein